MKYLVNLREAERWTPPLHIGTTNRILLTKKTVDTSNFTLWESTTQPGGGAEKHTHKVEQAYFILTGEASYEIGDERFQAGPGTAVFVPAGVPHSVKAVGKGPLSVLVIMAPPSEEFYP